jgi:ribosomal protein S2
MKLKKITEKLKLKVLTAQEKLENDVSSGYTSDLLSDVIANSKEDNLWITLQTHQNIIAVAKLKDLAGIIIVNDRQPEKETMKKAEEEKIPLMATQDSAFTISGKLYELVGPKD